MKTLEADDLIERLHNWEHVYPQDCDKPEGSLYIEAAEALAAKDAEIERLKAHLETMLQWADTMSAQINNPAEFWADYNAASEFLELAALTGEKGND